MIARRVLVALLIAGALFVTYGYNEATRDPVIRTATITDPSSHVSGPPVRLLLMSDVHVQGPDMPPSRVARIVEQANALRPDIIVIAGDFIGDSPVATRNYTVAQAIAPLDQLEAPLGVYAVLGNHDVPHAKETRIALQAAGARLLDNQTVQVGPVALGGYRPPWGRPYARLLHLNGTKIVVSHSPDAFPHIPAAVRLVLAGHTHCGQIVLPVVGALGGYRPPWGRPYIRLLHLNWAKIVVSHSPDAFPHIPSAVPLVLAGHTHCGQIVLPVVGALATGSEYGSRYLCGLIRENGHELVVTSGLGTSNVPIRIGAPPDMWLITIE